MTVNLPSMPRCPFLGAEGNYISSTGLEANFR